MEVTLSSSSPVDFEYVEVSVRDTIQIVPCSNTKVRETCSSIAEESTTLPPEMVESPNARDMGPVLWLRQGFGMIPEPSADEDVQCSRTNTDLEGNNVVGCSVTGLGDYCPCQWAWLFGEVGSVFVFESWGRDLNPQPGQFFLCNLQITVVPLHISLIHCTIELACQETPMLKLFSCINKRIKITRSNPFTT